MKYIEKLDKPEKIEVNDMTILHTAERILRMRGKKYNYADVFEIGLKAIPTLNSNGIVISSSPESDELDVVSTDTVRMTWSYSRRMV